MGRFEGARILVVEDHPTMREAMRLVGTGESAGDLEPFRAQAFAERLLGG